MLLKNREQIIRVATIGIIVYLLCFGMVMAFFPIRPFWNDEWRLVYNLKFKDVHGLWGRLDLLQQCPRTYLTVYKEFAAFFDYSYTSLRLPSLLIGTITVIVLWSLKSRIVPNHTIYSYLFVLIILSSQTFTDYLVQTKQYEMDLLLSILAFWQLFTLLEVRERGISGRELRFAGLCASFFIAPFFSYVYPIVVAPLFLVMLVVAGQSGNSVQGSRKTVNFMFVIIPLLLLAMSIMVFYLVDVRQLMSDNRMYQSYQQMLGLKEHENPIVANSWCLFSLVGSGLIFEVVFGILGIAAFLYCGYLVIRTKRQDYSTAHYLNLYAVLLLCLTLALMATGKLMGGVARLTVFTVPSISMLIIAFLRMLNEQFIKVMPGRIISGILFLALFGNVLSTCINCFTYPEYKNRILAFNRTAKALREARLAKIPLLYTDGVKGDKIDNTPSAPGIISAYNITPRQISGDDPLSAEIILKVNPEYKVWDTVHAYWMPDAKFIADYIGQLPKDCHAVIAGNGVTYQLYKRQ